ncbi:DUF4307 domain-containing protein [Actinomadura parmotrematis]|uniref:DUF4307 domain-containing protein n=1 Tax=Actinomadura parmotrematis TaxID=2864039 RepID=A0ABS7FP35_9ACTN|nr:DUF4307 domain-containing protein [Actinomadura parmotrematis]MBW8481539.1 DUF4307 domain-containing protein [Actinomadura parmotrematis]
MATSAPQIDKAGGHDPHERRGLGLAGWIVCGTLALLFAGGWAVIYSHVGQTPGISSQTYTWNVRSDQRVEVSYMISKPKGDTVRCTLQAYDTGFATVGQREVVAPAGVETYNRMDALTTTRKATGAQVKDCRKA